MRRGNLAALVLFVGVVFAFAACTAGCSSKGQASGELPEKVVKAIQKELPGAKILKHEKEDDTYEGLVEVEGKKQEVTVTADGKILEIEGEEEEEVGEAEREEQVKEEKEEHEEKAEEAEEAEEEEGEEREWTFEADAVGSLPEGWSNQLTGRGKPGRWEVVEDKTAPSGTHVLAQLSEEGAGYHFNLAVAEDTRYKDLELEVKFKPVKGREDRGGGPVWRFIDANNYYICRANPLESNFRVYKVVNGVRKMMQSARVEIPSGVWHSLKVVMKGNHIQCWYDGKKYLDVVDNTFPNAGKIGLWTKADAVTYFDNLEVEELK